ncbi:MAG: glycoside hydrolase family 15 protein [Actinomycetia bacterium]|nr:glycoside hydrolase family 15 protein [Actinomycetes bacterium]
MDLYDRSIEIILANQAHSGAYPASPNFPTYRYSWYRDGSYIAYAMDLVGEHDSSRRFHQWAATVVNARADTIRRAVAKAAHNEPLTGSDFLHTRYTIDGNEASGENWPDYQLDGFGTWLWSLNEHQRHTGIELDAKWRTAATLVADYLTALWARPSYDCWEEFPDNVHTHTLAAIHGGLVAHQAFDGADHRMTLAALSEFIETKTRMNGHYVKFPGSDAVDASLLGLAIPYRVVDLDHPGMLDTVAQIEATLRKGGGVHRYPTDTFYGGGEWLLLTCWLAWYYLESGAYGEAQTAIDWVEAHVTAEGHLPEQVPENLNDPACYGPWRERWGDSASPLLWSHAMYLVCETLRRHASKQSAN